MSLISEIYQEKPYGNNDSSYITDKYQEASGRQPFGENGYIKLSSIPGLPNNEVYDNGTVRIVFLLDQDNPIFLLVLQKHLDGWMTKNVAVHNQYTGRGFAVPVYLAVSKAYKQPLYSFTSQTPAGNKVWQNLKQKAGNRVVGFDKNTRQDIEFDNIYNGDRNTQAKLLPENVRADGDCYEAAAKEVLFKDRTKTLVHADILPRLGGPGIGKPYGHAWVEKGNMVWDLSNNHKGEMGKMFRNGVQKDLYYGIADPSNIKTYTAEQVTELIQKHQHWGPWPTNEGFELIDSELCESRLFRSTRRFATLTGRDIANLMYLNNLIMAMLYLDKDFNKTAKQYASATAQYSTYALFRTHATDMYLLAYQICHPDNDNFNIKDPVNSKNFLDRLKFSKDKHINFLRKIQRDYVDGSELTTYLFRLESQLNITDGRYKTWRRSVLDWPRLNDQNRRALVRRFQNELRVIGGGTGRGSELLISLDAINQSVAKPKATAKPKPKTDKYVSKPSISKIEKFWSRKMV